ncbi:urea-proton symporter DUR3 [Lingula anatina]|uniref:Urea-proton symporter DUR3 n=1 Tax=Lingula anatina TaxID=7574 RepID=A0A1S3HQ81_LINAN|nr:urea-proton symporter DUR3 [Lingula anatina]XP_013388211.1 urea-proton symporter DUR3 [Lingula anatina]XP_013388212.1 urea-proton symporter DUR3 [Lingula anatina]XP_013388213.1 urea-proton symporter DUR3 [Lingula anatina]|eukprot:XP_013388210.1 urea-proton symporter DUR3 [Lingula anatina]
MGLRLPSCVLLGVIVVFASLKPGEAQLYGSNPFARCGVNATINGTVSQGIVPTVELGKAVGLILGFGLFAVLVAMAFNLVRKYVYHDADNLDTAFDAGGNVSIGLTATTIVSQWTWSTTLLQSATVASKYGISGPFWYAAGATIQIVLFAILSIELKTKAPGAKTFLQVIKVRFGKATHITYCVFACLTNLVIMASLLLSGTAVLTSLVQGLNMEMACMIMAVIVGGYTLIGGLGATFYVSYFNTTLIFSLVLILVVEVYYNPYGNEKNPIGSASKMYDLLSCINGPPGNAEGSYLTFFSSGGLMFGVINIVGNFGTVFCDQAYWQSSIAAKPLQGVWGFISGGLTWFAIPLTMATTMGLAYLALAAESGQTMLSPTEVDKGLVPPLVAQKLLGTSGEYIILLLILMAVMSTGSAEVIAVASLIIYDIYKTYINPFRKNLPAENCMLCGKHRINECSCIPVNLCKICQQDALAARSKHELGVKPYNKCPVHGMYREYLAQLLNYKNWCILWVSAFTIPWILFCDGVQLNLSWVFLFTGVLIGSVVIPISLAITWSRMNAAGMISGAVVGCVLGITSWLITSSQHEGGLANFIINTGKEDSMLVGNCVSIGSGGITCIIVALLTNRRVSKEDVIAEWEKTRNIDNPLNPWVHLYRHLPRENKDARPSHGEFLKMFRPAKITAYSAGVILTVVLVIVWPGIMAALRVLSKELFAGWTYLSQGWSLIAATFIISVPLIQEVKGIWDQHKANKEDFHELSGSVENGLSGATPSTSVGNVSTATHFTSL